MANGAGDAIDLTLFRKAMSRFVTTITVITTEVNGEVRGMTANAFVSGSLESRLAHRVGGEACAYAWHAYRCRLLRRQHPRPG